MISKDGVQAPQSIWDMAEKVCYYEDKKYPQIDIGLLVLIAKLLLELYERFFKKYDHIGFFGSLKMYRETRKFFKREGRAYDEMERNIYHNVRSVIEKSSEEYLLLVAQDLKDVNHPIYEGV